MFCRSGDFDDSASLQREGGGWQGWLVDCKEAQFFPVEWSNGYEF